MKERMGVGKGTQEEKKTPTHKANKKPPKQPQPKPQQEAALTSCFLGFILQLIQLLMWNYLGRQRLKQ